jgi:hypothetical protein
MTERRYLRVPPGGTIPVTVPGDVMLAEEPGRAVWVGAIMVFQDSFMFTLLVLSDVQHGEAVPALAWQPGEHDRAVWLEVRFSDGRCRAADLNTNTPLDQPQGPHLTVVDAEADFTRGQARSRWWVRPLPPPGPVELTVHLDGNGTPAVAVLDGGSLVEAATWAQVQWPDTRAG